jgi:hypothetical protein
MMSSASSTGIKSSKSTWTRYAAVFAVFVAIAPVAFPSFCWHTMMVVDGFIPFMYKSPVVDAYHKYLISTLKEDVEPEDLPILMAADATAESLSEITNKFNSPVVVKGVLADVDAIRLWGNKSWWMENYGDENIMVSWCGHGIACVTKMIVVLDFWMHVKAVWCLLTCV